VDGGWVGGIKEETERREEEGGEGEKIHTRVKRIQRYLEGT
jgi:hypothetical protein